MSTSFRSTVEMSFRSIVGSQVEGPFATFNAAFVSDWLPRLRKLQERGKVVSHMKNTCRIEGIFIAADGGSATIPFSFNHTVERARQAGLIDDNDKLTDRPIDNDFVKAAYFDCVIEGGKMFRIDVEPDDEAYRERQG